MKKRSQFIKKSGLLMGAVLVCMSFPGRITWAEESNEITADQAEERKERILTSSWILMIFCGTVVRCESE